MLTWSRSPSRLLAVAGRWLRAPGRRSAQNLTRLCIIVVAALAWRAYAAPPPAEKQAAPVPKVAEACAACHEGQAASWAQSVHRRTAGAPQLAEDRQGCGGCHTGIAKHLEDPSNYPPNLAKAAGDEVAAICLSCHKGGQQMMWHTSSHSKLAGGCLTCHDPHGGKGRTMLKHAEPKLCQECHPQQVAETYLPSHHPIPEGKMVCSDCHSVHGDERNNLSGESTSEMCYKCHSEKAGPFAGEHPPVTEDCANCHKPHGAQNDRLLKADEPFLCLQCHPGHGGGHRSEIVPVDPANPNPPNALNGGIGQTTLAIMGFFDKCTSCHALIHGTDLVSSNGIPTFMPGGSLTDIAGLPQRHTSATNSTAAWGLAGLAALPTIMGDGAAWGFSDLELGRIDQTGNPTFVREYDGKNYEFPRVDLNRDQYGAKSDFHFRVKDPGAGNEDAEAYFGNSKVSGSIEFSELTHREPRFNDIKTGAGFDGLPGIAIPTLGSNLIRVEDLTNGKNDFSINRQVADIQLAARHPKLRTVRWLGNFWRQSKDGSQQFLFLQRCDGCHKTQIEQPINNVTTLLSGGAEVAFDKGAVRYMHTEGRFENRAPETVLPTFGFSRLLRTDVPLFGVADNKTRADEVRLAAMPASRVALDGLWRTKRRDNLFNGTRLDIDTAGGGANWQIASGLNLVASYFSSDFDNGARALNAEAISRDRKTARAELRYTRIKGTTLSAGYKREDVDRTTEHSSVPANSKAKTWSAAAYSNLPGGLTLNVRYHKTDTDVGLNTASVIAELVDSTGAVSEVFQSRFISPPTDEKLLSAVAGYNVTPQLMVNALYSKLDQDFNMGINFINPVTTAPVSISRATSNESRTAGGELHYRIGRQTKLTGGYYNQTGSGITDAQFGTEPLDWAGFTWPAIASTAAFDYDAKIWRLNAAHWLTPRVRLFGRYNRTNSEGSVIANDLGDFLDGNPDLNGVALRLNPFDIFLTDWWLGAGYLLDPATEVALSFQKREWENRNDATQDGSFDLWRLALRKKF